MTGLCQPARIWIWPTLTLLAQVGDGDARAQMKYLGYQGEIAAGAVLQTFEADVAVREKPTVESRLLVRLPIGHPVKLVEASKSKFSWKGIDEPWFHVTFVYQGKPYDGFVWSALLALVAFDVPGPDRKASARLLFGVSEVKKNGEVTAQARMVAGDQLLAQVAVPLSVESIFGYVVAGELLGDQGFSPPVQVVRLKLTYEACGYDNPEVILLWDGKALHHAATGHNVSEAGVFHQSTAFVFPRDKGGQPNQLKLIGTISSCEDEECKKETTEKSTQVFVWDGKTVSEKPAPAPATKPR